jgi:hypothetical protein
MRLRMLQARGCAFEPGAQARRGSTWNTGDPSHGNLLAPPAQAPRRQTADRATGTNGEHHASRARSAARGYPPQLTRTFRRPEMAQVERLESLVARVDAHGSSARCVCRGSTQTSNWARRPGSVPVRVSRDASNASHNEPIHRQTASHCLVFEAIWHQRTEGYLRQAPSSSTLARRAATPQSLRLLCLCRA